MHKMIPTYRFFKYRLLKTKPKKKKKAKNLIEHWKLSLVSRILRNFYFHILHVPIFFNCFNKHLLYENKSRN